MLRETFSGSATLRDARARYFEILHVPDGGYDARWVRLKAGPIPFAIPNTAGRQRAVRFHDLHHVLTGYRPDWRGECEISTWELASGMGSFWTGFAINAGAFLLGFVLCPRRAFAAWVRGRRSGNLYRRVRTWDEALLDERVDDVRARVGVAGDADGSLVDVATWLGFALLLLAPAILALAILALALVSA